MPLVTGTIHLFKLVMQKTTNSTMAVTTNQIDNDSCGAMLICLCMLNLINTRDVIQLLFNWFLFFLLPSML